MTNVHDFKDRAILFIWITGFLLIISLIWIITQPLQTNYLLRSVNSVLINNNDSRRLSAYIADAKGAKGLFGYWYSINNSTDTMFVFTIFQNGILVPLGAVISDEGVSEIIPLSSHAVRIFDNLPESILQMYIRRIESAALANREGRTR